jgi:hypothetical protein
MMSSLSSSSEHLSAGTGEHSVILEQTGGYRVGRNSWFAFNASWPFGTLQVRPHEIALRCISRSYLFSASSVERLSFHDGLFSSGLRIEHSVADYPVFIAFWSPNIEELQRGLREAGFHVSD